MKRSILLISLLASGYCMAGAQETESPASQQTESSAVQETGPSASQVSPPTQTMTQQEVDALLLDASKKEAENTEHAGADAGAIQFRPWSPPAVAPTGGKTAPPRGSQFRTANVTDKGNQHYAAQWGIDTLKVAYTSSGNLLRFSYRVLDPARAAPLADKTMTPSLYSPKSHAALSVPVMEKIGPLRQAMGQKAGSEYWMVFSNKGQLVKPGDRVNVTIGSFHADGLRVE
jgi:hypothetical protein